MSYTFHHPAGYHEQGTALAHVQHTWGNAIAPHWLTCLGYNFTPNGSIEVPKSALVPYKTECIYMTSVLLCPASHRLHLTLRTPLLVLCVYMLQNHCHASTSTVWKSALPTLDATVHYTAAQACKQAPAQMGTALQTILDMSVAEGQFAIGYHTPSLHWFLDSFAPKTSLTSDVGGSTAIQDLS